MIKKRLFWKVVKTIEEKIKDGTYEAGARLPSERILVEELGVSRPTIRQAMIALEVLGKVEVRSNKGVYLLDQSICESSEQAISAFELTQARALVEGETVALAALNITDEELSELEQCIEDMKKGDFEKADADFHLVIANSTRNKAMVMAVNKFWELRENSSHISDAYRNVCYLDDAQRLHEHQQILIALKNHQPEESRIAMHEHFKRMINSLFEASEIQALKELKARSHQTRDLYSIENIR